MVTTSGSLSRGDLSASSSAASIDSARSESSWTPYIVDFLTHGDRENSSYDADQHRGSSMVSDAATKSSGGNSVQGRAGGPGRELRLKKRKNKGKSLVDEALEDTASSPNNSPKVCGFRLPDIYPKKRECELLATKGNESTTHEEIKNDGPIIGGRGERDQSSELRKKGLRLVPVSMAVKYQLG